MTGGHLAITALGATTAVGRTAVSTAAAIRAGIARPREILEPEILDLETHEPVPVIGHPARGVTDGFSLLGRWLRMASAAVADLVQTMPTEALTPAAWQGTVLLLATPEPDPTVFLAEQDEIFLAIRDQVAVAMLEDAGLAIPIWQIELLPYGHVSFAGAVTRARARVGVDCARALVVAVDSLLDPLLLENLSAQDRVKHAGNPVGFAPGEAAVALMLEPVSSPTPSLAVVRGSFIDVRSRDVHGASDHALADVCINAVLDAGLEQLDGDIYLDLSGEFWRARQWGDATPRLQGRLAGPMVLPATSVGDTGAASGALSACLAARAFARGYARSSQAAVVSMGEKGSVSCVVLGAPAPAGVQ